MHAFQRTVDVRETKDLIIVRLSAIAPSVPMSRQGSVLTRVRDALLVAGQWCAIAGLFAVPLNKPATNIAIGLAIIFSLLGANVGQRWRDAARHPVARGALAWWGVLMLSALHTWYATASFPRTGTFVWVFCYPLALGSLLQTLTWRRRALLAFALAVTLVLLASCAMAMGLLPQRPEALASPIFRNTVFKEYTQQGMSTLMLACMAVAVAMATRSSRMRIGCVLLAVLALVNVTLMLESRTTYLTLLPLAIYWICRFILRRPPGKRLVLAFSIALVASAALVGAWSTNFVQKRLVQAVPQEIHLYLNHRQPTSTGIRLELWRRTLPIIASAPVFGHGLREWEPLYHASIMGLPHLAAFDMGHPHQDMLLIAAEQGLTGLAIYLLLLLALVRYLRQIDRPERDIFICVVLIFVTAGLANGLWADFTHRHVFVLLLTCIPLATLSREAARPSPLTTSGA